MIFPMKIERIKRGMTQYDLWMKSGIPQWRISLIERGVEPRADEREKLAMALGVPEEIIGSKIAQKFDACGN